MNRLSFDFSDSPSSNDHQVRPLIDGADLLQLVGTDSLGIDPPEFFRQPALRSGGRLLIGRCSCGVVGCDDLHAHVVSNDDSVTWLLAGGRSYGFDPAGYSSCIESAATNTDWESTERTAERLVSCLDFSSVEGHGYRFDWASARISRGRITLSFWKENTQRLFEVGWDERDPEDAAKQVRRWLREYEQ
jgi:hypothetical protein